MKSQQYQSINETRQRKLQCYFRPAFMPKSAFKIRPVYISVLDIIIISCAPELTDTYSQVSTVAHVHN